MNVLEGIRLLMLIAHFVGLAAVIGPFILQMRRRVGLDLSPMLVGSIVQLVSGIALIASRRLQDLDVSEPKVITKLVVALLVLGAVVAGIVLQRRAGATGSTAAAVRLFMLAAGTLAIVNVVIAVVWR